jgi:nucleoside-diphosphate-sugar epimerase
LADALLADGHEVLGVDCFTPYYDRSAKDANLASSRRHHNFHFAEADIRSADLTSLFDWATVLFHLAAQPGVRLSWSSGFPEYESHNIAATQRVLEAAKNCNRLERLVYASSSSVYGDAPRYPTYETDVARPHSPYGVTKLAGENLCSLYAANWGVPTVSLRYFTVYGPRQRPDMAFARLISSARQSRAFPLFGDGSQIRDFTFVADVVSATLAASEADVSPGEVINIGGGEPTTMSRAMKIVEELVDREIRVDSRPQQPGDVIQTGAAIELAERLLHWSPSVSLQSGLESQVRWDELRGAS